jgi:hypothetical protein
MGFVWNIMLSFSNEELWEAGEEQPLETCKPLEQINAWIDSKGFNEESGSEHSGCGRLVELIGPTYDDNAGYGMDANLFGGGFKNFNIEGFIEVVEGQHWKDPGTVQLWVKGACEGGDEGLFELVKLRRRKLSHDNKPDAASPKAKRQSRTRRNSGLT